MFFRSRPRNTRPDHETAVCEQPTRGATLCHNAGSSSHTASPVRPGEEDSTAVLCRGRRTPRYLNGSPTGPDYEPTLILYSPNKELECVCKADSIAQAKNASPAFRRTSTFALVLTSGFGLAPFAKGDYGSDHRRAWMSCQIVGCRDWRERRHGAPDIRTAARISTATRCEEENSSAPRRTRIRRKLITAIAVLTVTLVLASGRCRALYGADRLLLIYCESTISVHLSAGLLCDESRSGTLGGHRSLGLDRCGRQNEFTVPARVKFHKAIRCFKGSKQYKRAPAGPRKQGVSGLQGFKSDTPECRRPRWAPRPRGSDIQQDGRRREVGGEIRGLERRCRSRRRRSMPSGQRHGFALRTQLCVTPSHGGAQRDPKGGSRISGHLGLRVRERGRSGGYYSSFEVFSTCNKDAEESLDDAAERCRETGANFKVEGFGAGASAGGSTARCDTRGLSDSERKTLASISRESRTQIGGDNLGGEVDWESTPR
ncbi:hypothetical protein Q5P01_000910 [Channa striata]|uniref:Uncharacterized protein n=1 Tax=Channa striata TaxID=64152 RepID=A0AA88IGZ7_CHASR|nr:hypothetical protein Q5P01_000910 [Channa striata]